jgi:hypothetical protein
MVVTGTDCGGGHLCRQMLLCHCGLTLCWCLQQSHLNRSDAGSKRVTMCFLCCLQCNGVHANYASAATELISPAHCNHSLLLRNRCHHAALVHAAKSEHMPKIIQHSLLQTARAALLPCSGRINSSRSLRAGHSSPRTQRTRQTMPLCAITLHRQLRMAPRQQKAAYIV